MFCHKCGAQIEDTSMFCPYCGTQVGKPASDSISRPTPQQQPPQQQYYQQPPQQQYYQQPPQPQYYQQPQQQNTLAIVGFILSFFVSLAGLICSILGYKAAKRGAPHGGLAMAGIIISAISVGLSVLLWIFYGTMLSAILSGAYYGF